MDPLAPNYAMGQETSRNDRTCGDGDGIAPGAQA
ncbi:MAG: hypothetical protein QOF13_1991 [Solirubrobacterales bacterium]|jgi:hypothetical protein|nr:hypothetical protein [Solirubrobacterales bacterium]